jgi:hypothetical protein
MATGQKTIEAYVTEVLTAVPAKGIRNRGDLLIKSYERLFRSRVPLAPRMYDKITVRYPWTYAELGEADEAWGFRCIQDERRFIDREEIARRWFAEEYTPVVRMLSEAGLLGHGPMLRPAEARSASLAVAGTILTRMPFVRVRIATVCRFSG